MKTLDVPVTEPEPENYLGIPEIHQDPETGALEITYWRQRARQPRPRPTETEEARLRLMSYLPDGARVYHRTTYSQRGSQRYIRFYCVVPTSAGAEKFHGIEDITGLVARVTASRRAPSGANIGAIATRGADAGLLIYNLGYALRGRNDLRALAL